MNYDTIFKKYANQTLDWFNTDSKEVYEKNLIEKYDELSQNNWIDSHFTYKFNSLGFRSEEFNSDPSIMFLGCSYTFGIGLPVDKIYPSLVSQTLNLRCVNLGVPGGSSDTAFRLCHGYIDKINPKIVVFMTPPGVRFELVNNYQPFNISATSPHTSIYKFWAVDDNNDYFNKEKNLLAIESLCSKRNIKFINVNYDVIPMITYARELCHPGIDSHKIGADHILSLI
jgi:hypothetical protein